MKVKEPTVTTGKCSCCDMKVLVQFKYIKHSIFFFKRSECHHGYCKPSLRNNPAQASSKSVIACVATDSAQRQACSRCNRKGLLLMCQDFAQRVQKADKMQPIEVGEGCTARLGSLHGMLYGTEVRHCGIALQERRLIFAKHAQHIKRLPDVHHRVIQPPKLGRLHDQAIRVMATVDVDG